MLLAVRMMPTMVAVALAGCALPGESLMTDTSVMKVHWKQYKNVDPVCRRISRAEPIDSDPPEFATACGRVLGHDCYVYTNEGRIDLIGDFVKYCFDKIQTGTKRGVTSQGGHAPQ
jgi:hypothetical protein